MRDTYQSFYMKYAYNSQALASPRIKRITIEARAVGNTLTVQGQELQRFNMLLWNRFCVISQILRTTKEELELEVAQGASERQKGGGRARGSLSSAKLLNK